MIENHDEIVQIILKYYRVVKIESKQISVESHEMLLIDRDSQTLELIETVGTGCKITRKYEIDGGIDSLLDSFSSEKLFAEIASNPDDDFIDTPNDIKTYSISIRYAKYAGTCTAF